MSNKLNQRITITIKNDGYMRKTFKLEMEAKKGADMEQVKEDIGRIIETAIHHGNLVKLCKELKVIGIAAIEKETRPLLEWLI